MLWWISMQRLLTQVLCGIDSVYPEMETGVASKPHMNDVYVEAFNNQTFNQDGDETVILKK